MKYLRSITILTVFSLFMVIPLAIAQKPVDDQARQEYRVGGMITERYYYSDYFTTEVGWDVSDYCDPLYPYFDSMGTTDGAYMFATWYHCGPNGGSGVRCYQKVNGEWYLISCPQW